MEDELVEVLGKLGVVLLELLEGLAERGEMLDLIGEGFDDLGGEGSHYSKWKMII